LDKYLHLSESTKIYAFENHDMIAILKITTTTTELFPNGKIRRMIWVKDFWDFTFTVCALCNKDQGFVSYNCNVSCSAAKEVIHALHPLFANGLEFGTFSWFLVPGLIFSKYLWYGYVICVDREW
jgi:hypothetical protein